MKPIEEIISSLRIAMTDARQNESHFESWMILNEAICDAIEALAEQPAQQKSVGYVYSVHGERIKNACIESDVPNGTPLYTSPQSKPWVGLTWDDMPDSSCDDPAFLAGAQWANSKLKEKNA